MAGIRIRDIFRVKAAHVACPGCGAAPHRSCLSPMGNLLGVFHKPRIALARRVSSILQAHFEVRERPCTGAAHSNPFIDHCMVCMPGWGTVQYLTPKEVVS